MIDKLFHNIENNPKYHLLMLGIITLTAYLLRFYKLGEWGFWGDEYITVRKALAITETNYLDYPASLLATRTAMDVWGVNEWSARFVSVMIGVLSVPVIYFLVKKIYDPMVALIACLLLAISPWHIYWSQNARFYTTLLLFFTLALFSFYYGIEKDKPWYLILSLGLLSLALKERLIAGLFVPVVVGYSLLVKLLPFEKPKGLRLRNLILFFGSALLGAIILILKDPSLGNPERFQIAFGFINNDPFWLLGGVIFYVGIPVLCLSVVGAVYLLKQRDRLALLLSLACVIPILTVLVISLFLYSANRYTFISLTSLIILASVTTKELLWQTPKKYKILVTGFSLILVVNSLGDNFLYYQFQNGNRDNWKEAFAVIADLKQVDDLVMTTNRDLADYYLQESTMSMQGQEVSNILKRQNRTWFVIDLTAPDKAPQIHQWVLQNAVQVASLDVNVSARTFPMRVYLFDP